MKERYDICIAGGGAAGLACAAFLMSERPGLRVLVVEKKDRPGRKIAASGNGRCNLSNLAAPGYPETKAFFEGLGLLTMSDGAGRVYPHSEDSRDVVDCLVSAAEKGGAEILCGTEVKAIRPANGGFEVELQGAGEKAARVIRTDKVLLATGGKAAPKLGTAGDGYRIAKGLGHTVTRLRPALTGVDTAENMKKQGLSGIRQKARVTLSRRGEATFSEEGEVQFTDTGISGIAVFNMSRYMDLDEGGFGVLAVSLDFLPECTGEEAAAIAAARPTLRSVVKENLAKAVLAQAEKTGRSAGAVLKDFRLTPTGLRGWDQAQVTRGGVPPAEVDPATSESKLVPGLYIAGELLDEEGPCGGFNLQQAWTTGTRAAGGMLQKLK